MIFDCAMMYNGDVILTNDTSVSIKWIAYPAPCFPLPVHEMVV